MKKIYITIAGMNHYYGSKMLERGMKVSLEKDTENEYDKEAIKAVVKGLGTIGYVANSPYTVAGECYSAGRIYDQVTNKTVAKVEYLIPNALVCSIKTTN